MKYKLSFFSSIHLNVERRFQIVSFQQMYLVLLVNHFWA